MGFSLRSRHGLPAHLDRLGSHHILLGSHRDHTTIQHVVYCHVFIRCMSMSIDRERTLVSSLPSERTNELGLTLSCRYLSVYL